MVKGSCLCGGVTFEVDGEIGKLTHCHCSMCRKEHGSSFATYAEVPVGNFRFTAGTDLISHYKSSDILERTFCKRCGSVTPAEDDGIVFIAAGLLDDDLGDTEQSHIFVTSKAPWHEIKDDLPQFEGYEENPGLAVEQPDLSSHEEGVIGGSCLCGAVAFEIRGEPAFMRNCHCSRCRHAKGAAHATNMFVKPEQLTWMRGEDHVVRFDLPGAKLFGNAFCDVCGSSLPRQAPGGPMVNVPAGSLNDDPGVRPDGHIFFGSKASWYDPHDDLPKHEEMPTG